MCSTPQLGCRPHGLIVRAIGWGGHQELADAVLVFNNDGLMERAASGRGSKTRCGYLGAFCDCKTALTSVRGVVEYPWRL